MNTSKKHIILLFVSFLVICSSAQETDPQKMMEAIIESHLDKIDEQTDVALIIEDLEGLLEKPININATNADELARLYLLNPVQIDKLLTFVNEYGPVYTIFELNSIDGFSRDLLQKMQPFIVFGPSIPEKVSLKDQFKYGRHEAIFRSLGTLQKARGYVPGEDGTTPYEGNRVRYYARYRYEIRNKLSAGFVSEKDPGEAFFKGSNKNGFDYYSGHVSVGFNHPVKNVTIGDFLVRTGQGLVLWQGYTSGKSADVLGVTKTGQGVRPYTSVNENAFFRGVASTIDFGRTEIVVFGSHKKADGNLVINDDESKQFSSLQTSGYHRTESEIEDEKSIKATDLGAVLLMKFNNLKIGANFIYQHFDIPFMPNDQLYNQFRFHGKENYNGSVDYFYSKGKYLLFGEAALSKSGGKAILQGAVAHLNDQVGFSFLIRHFDKNYHALWANTFAEGSNISNESGLYFGTRILPLKFVTVSLYSDLYQSKWISYSTTGPSQGWDIFAQADAQISEQINFYIRYKNEEKKQKNKAEKLYVDIPERTQKIRLHFDYRLSESIKLRSRLEHVYYHGVHSENGFLIFQDVQYTSIHIPLGFTVRVAWFHTDSYDSRIYAYENDLLYTFSVPAFYGKGFRTYLNLKYRITNHIECWLKLANTHWSDRNMISSGYNEINGKNKTELKIQFRLKF